MVAHTFTCPQGLYFNSLTDGCDFRRNVDCEGKEDTEEDAEPSSTTSRTTAAASNKSKPGEPETLEDVLEAIKQAGKLCRLLMILDSSLDAFLYIDSHIFCRRPRCI
jgi:hypothetical protein